MTDAPLKHFSVSFQHIGEEHVSTMAATDIDAVYGKLAQAVAQQQARVAEVQYYQMLQENAPDGSPAQRAGARLEHELCKANVENLFWSQVSVEGTTIDGLGLDKNKFFENLEIEEIPGPNEAMRPGLHAIVVEVSCEGDFEDLDPEALDADGNCIIDGSHYFVFEHPDQDVSPSQALRDGQDLFMDVLGNGYQELGDFQFYTRAVSSTDHAAEFTHTHGIYIIESEPTPTPGM